MKERSTYTHFFYVEEIDCFIVSFIKRYYKQNVEKNMYIDTENNDFLDSPFVSEDVIEQQFIFDKIIGARHLYFGEIMASSQSNDRFVSIALSNTIQENQVKNESYTLFLEFMKTFCNENSAFLQKNYSLIPSRVAYWIKPEIAPDAVNLENYKLDTFSGAGIFYNRFLKESKARKNPTEETDNSELEINYKFIQSRINKVDLHHVPVMFSAIKDMKYTYATIFCHCGHKIEKQCELNIANLSSYTYIKLDEICPKCGNHIDQQNHLTHEQSNNCSANIMWMEKLGEEKVVARYGSVNLGISDDELSITVFENIRVILTPKKMFYYKKTKLDKNEFSLIKSNSKEYRAINYSLINPCCLNTEEELEDIINSTFLVKTGLLHAWGLGDFKDYKINEIGTLSDTSFMAQYYRKPYIELTVKSKLKELTSELMRTTYNSEYKKQTIYEMLDISKNMLKIIRENNLDLSQITLLKRCFNIDSGFNSEMWYDINHIEAYVSIHTISLFLQICEKYQISIKRLLEYLQSCYNHQCIHKVNALNIFNDYLGMASSIGYDLNDKNIKFPNSLKKEHDKASFAYAVVQDEAQKKMFTHNALLFKRYEYEDNDFIVIVPQTADDVVREGQLQRHCVASYVERIRQGETCVCFIRKKNDVETPYYTCEIYHDSIHQVRGYCNCSVKEATLSNFIENWAKKKHLQLDYYSR